MSEPTAENTTTNKMKLSLHKDKWLNTISIGLFVIGLACVGYVLISNFIKKRELANLGNLDCVTATDLARVEDEHMSGVFEKGETLKVLTGFYNCNEAKRGEIAWFRFSEHISPVARFIRGLPGDKYALTENPAKKGQWTLSINGEQVKAGSEIYYLESNTVPPLKTYEISRGGVLRPDEYILLSNKPPGLSDSSNLGLINKKALVGKVIPKE
jgi:hypothetical protein